MNEKTAMVKIKTSRHQTPSYRSPVDIHFGKALMVSISCVRKVITAGLIIAGLPVVGLAQGSFAPEGGEYAITGTLPGEQVYPQLSIKPSGGYLVWHDNVTDGAGYGVSARKLDGSLSGSLSVFRVNQTAADDQERPVVTLLNDGGAAFVWQGGRQSFQHIYARFLSGAGTWATGDVLVNATTNFYQLDPRATTLSNGTVVVAYSSLNQAAVGSMRDIYFQLFTPNGTKIGTEARANQVTAMHQRSPAIAPLRDGRFILVWVSEDQRFVDSVDVFGRFFSATGVPAGGEFLINTGTNVCAHPTVAATSDGGFAVAWMQKDGQTLSNGWDIVARPFTANGFGGVQRLVNTTTFGDQYAPSIAATGTDFLVTWTSMGQDGAREGVYGQFLAGDGSLAGEEFRINGATAGQQMQQSVASDGAATFLVAWTSFVGGAGVFDLMAQRYVNTDQPLAAPGAPIVMALSSNALAVTWPPVSGLAVQNYEVYADGAATATAVVTNIYWTHTGLAPVSTHNYRLAYVLTDGRRSPLSAATGNTTYAAGATWGGIPQEWMVANFGADMWLWPAPHLDSDGDGVSNRDEFLAGTDPNSASSVLKVRLEPTPQGLFLNWNTQPGLVYQVWESASANSPWNKVGGPRFAAGSVDSMYLGLGGNGFYRIERLR
jgi:hypothetical protein